MVLNQYIQNLIRNKTGNHLTLSSQFELLSKDIFDVTGNVLSVNTLKRLFGRLADVSTSHTTLNIIAEYLGFENWEKLESVAENGNSCLCSLKDTVFPKDLDTGTRIEICYEPSRKLLLEITDDKHCRVISSAGGKLCEGDILYIAEITAGYSLIVSNVERGGQQLGRYVGGIEGGVKYIRIL